MKLGIIGYGAIGQNLLRLITQDPDLAETVRPVVLMRRPVAAPVAMVHNIENLLEHAPDLIVECAGHTAVAGPVLTALRAGFDCAIASLGALADDTLHGALSDAAKASGARLILPAGAIGGIDLLSALRPSGLSSVIYEGRKPPSAWAGSPAQDVVNLSDIRRPTPFFTGTAREAALAYPKNANVAATVALAGLGFDDTTVTLVADPAASGNTHRITAKSGAAEFTIDINGLPSPENPRSSMTTIYSLLRTVRNKVTPQII